MRGLLNMKDKWIKAYRLHKSFIRVIQNPVHTLAGEWIDWYNFPRISRSSMYGLSPYGRF